MAATSFQGFDASYEPVTITTKPTTEKWVLPLMYRWGMTGVEYAWQIGFDGKMLQTVSGTINAPQYADRMVEQNSTGRSLNEQALIQARSKYKNKFYSGYQLPGATDPPMVKAMKGTIYEDPKQIKKWPVLLSWKLNGVRTLARYSGGKEVHLTSYLNRSFDHLDRIREQVLLLMPYLPPYTTLDGEVYLHGMSFDDVISTVKTVKTKHERRDDMIYHIFDMYTLENPPMDYRYSILRQAYDACMADGNALPNIFICDHWKVWNHEQILQSMGMAMERGFEGVVIRYSCEGLTPADKKLWELTRYKFERSVHMLKLKKFYDEEGVVIRVEAATGKEKHLAMLILRDKFGFEVPIRGGTNEQRAAWLQYPTSILGKMVTFKHVGRNPNSNVAIQPTIVAVRDYEIPKGVDPVPIYMQNTDTILVEF